MHEEQPQGASPAKGAGRQLKPYFRHEGMTYRFEFHNGASVLLGCEHKLKVVNIPDRRLIIEQRGRWVDVDGLLGLESLVAVSRPTELCTIVKVTCR